jgi:hypothetical protein
MVHALAEIRRVLAPNGILIDIRPFADHWPVEVASSRGFKAVGRVDDLPEQVNVDVASNEAMTEVESRGWFIREQAEFFSFLYSWDTPSEMEEYVAEDWTDFARLSDDAKEATRSAWASSDADARVQIRVKILISRWQVAKDL